MRGVKDAKDASAVDSVDAEPKNCFTIAIEKKSWACANVLLDIVQAGFKPEAVKAPNPGSERGDHVTDFFLRHQLIDQFK